MYCMLHAFYFVVRCFPSTAWQNFVAVAGCFSTEDCSSTSTFNGVGHILEVSRPHVAILENVDSMDTPTGEVDDDQEHLICSI